MKTLEEPKPELGEGLDADALIEEARQRQRKRRWLIGIVVLVVAVASGMWAVSGGGSATKPPSSSKKPSHVNSPSKSGSEKKAAASSADSTFSPWVLAVTFPSPNRGFASVASDCGSLHCYLSIESTANGGITWHQVARLVRPPQPTQLSTTYGDETRNDLWFANADDGVLFGAASPVVLVTHDGGKRWKSLRVPGVTVQALSVRDAFVLVVDRCAPASLGYPTCGKSEIVVVPVGNDVVTSVHRMPSCMTNGPVDVISVGSILMASGCDAFFRSGNLGATWKEFRSPFRSWPTLIAADSASDIWAISLGLIGVGAERKWVYRSHNGGEDWQLVGRASGGSPLFGPSIGNLPISGYALTLVAPSAQHALLLSDRFGLSATFDGGRLWVSPASGSSQKYGGVAGGMACIGPTDCWAGLDTFPVAGPHILRTINGGRSWTAVRVG